MSASVSSLVRLSYTTSRNVAILHLARPEALNALNTALIKDLNTRLSALSSEKAVRAVVLASDCPKAFAAGADIKMMMGLSKADCERDDFLSFWFKGMNELGKPIIAAVDGLALGGGCELAMMCDIILAGPNATFGQPEIKLGVIPGAGATQRLTKLLGPYRAADMILSGRQISAEEAERWGLVSRIVKDQPVLTVATDLAEKIAQLGTQSVEAARAAIRTAQETSLTTGISKERSLFYGLFDSDDKIEGMSAFISKRKAVFNQ